MNPFSYSRADDVAEAVSEVSRVRTAKFIAGGTNLIDLMKENVARPRHLIDITHLPLNRIQDTDEGGLRIGALVTNSDTAYNPQVEMRYPLLSRAILSGASPQLRNMATNGGNLLQRTRCYYFYDMATPCNKRERGTGCSALEGFNRMHAVLGASDQCVAVHPSDMSVALLALDAVVQVRGTDGYRSIPITDFHRLPGDTPDIDTNLGADEIILSIDLPPKGFADHHAYLKVRDRTSYAFALVSVAAALEMSGSTINDARIALGGVAHRPWRNKDSEALLHGKPASEENFQNAADAILKDARGLQYNSFKIVLARRAIVRALKHAAHLEKQQ